MKFLVKSVFLSFVLALGAAEAADTYQYRQSVPGLSVSAAVTAPVLPVVGDGVSKAGACASGAATGCATWDTVTGYSLSSIAFSNANLTATTTVLGCPEVRFSVQKTTGKAYFEISAQGSAGTPYVYFNGTYIGMASVGVYGIAVDYDAKTFTVRKNGALVGTKTASAMTPGFVQLCTTGNKVTANFGQAAFQSPVPVGYNAGLW